MKKILAIFLACLSLCIHSDTTFALGKSVTVSAIVGSINHPSQVQITNPSALNTGTKKYVKIGTSFTVDFSVSDTDTATVFYTITPSAGSVSVSSAGPIAVPFTKQFTYLAPTTVPGSGNNQTITIAVNDGSSVTYKIINLYVY